MRKMATVRRIDAINPIPNADAIEVATVGGWKVVVKKGEFAPGDLAVYCEIDSWIPHMLAPFLSKTVVPREFEGVPGERLRTVKLRGQVSQGLLLSRHVVLDKVGEIVEGMDVAELLGILKWEASVPAQLAGEARGSFPGFIPKTDQERVQNLTRQLTEWSDLLFEVTEKLDGSSMTVFVMGDEEGVCSRNLQLVENDNNSFWKAARQNRLIEKLRSTGRNLALQGELIGEGIQGNPYKIHGQQFHVFDIYDIDAGAYMTPNDRMELTYSLGLTHVPVIEAHAPLLEGVDQLLEWSEGKSQLMSTAEREGLVFKCHTEQVTFKAISNRFLLRG